VYRRDTIVARATPPGRGAVAIIRLSGDDAFSILDRMFVAGRSESGSAAEGWRLRHGVVRTDVGGDDIDEVLVVRMPGPVSYTGEDVAEIQCHGSPLVCERIERAAITLGARPAERGEFTRRAVLNGRMDLVQAEAVADLIDARMDAGARAAWDQLQGALSQTLTELRTGILEVLADLEAAIDFADEDLPAGESGLRLVALDRVAAQIDELLSGFPVARRRREGYATVFTGRPNVGKSSLVNALLGHQRMIVSDEPGTTRDSVEEEIDLGAAALILTDTAGLRPAPGAAETVAVDRARSAAADADILVVTLDGSRPLAAEERDIIDSARDRCAIVVVNKKDLRPGLSPADRALLDRADAPVIEVCALSGAGVSDLASALRCVAEQDSATGSPATTISRVRHRSCLERAAVALNAGRQIVAADGPPELASVELRTAAGELAAITHPLDNEEILDHVFSTFCIGK